MQYDPIKDTPEWESLNSIWKSCSKEQKELLRKDFEVLAKLIRKQLPNDKIYLGHNQNSNYDDYRYLNDLSKEAKDFIISVVNKGEKNIYHSIMAVINNKYRCTKDDIIEFYCKKYGTERPYIAENRALVCEIINFCWNKTHPSK